MGEWVSVTIDDYIPCYYKGGPIFTKGKPLELWPILVEKAYAKLFGTFSFNFERKFRK